MKLAEIGSRLLWCAVAGTLVTMPAVARVPPSSTQSNSAQLQPCGNFSDYLVVVQNSPRLDPPGLHFSIMSSRYQDLTEAIRGHELSGQPLVAFEGGRFAPAGYSDDPGIYLFIPWIARHARMTLAASVATFFLSALVLATSIGCLGFWFALKSDLGKLWGVAGVLLLGLIAYRIGDVYIFELAVPVALLPWALRFVSTGRPPNSRSFPVFMFIAGLVTGAASVIRTSAGLPTLVFLGVLSFLGSTRLKLRAAVLSLLVCGFLLPKFYFYELSSIRNSFLASTSAGQQVETTRHVFWHFAYVGLGFLSNAYVPGGICDEVGKARVHAIDPNAIYLSAEYDRILRRETLATVWHHPTVVMFTFFAKAGIIAGLFVLFANFGLFAAFIYRKSVQLEVAFWAALAICSGPLLLMAPLPLYCMGLVSWATIYGIVSLDCALALRQRPAFHEGDSGRKLVTAAAPRLSETPKPLF